MSFVVRNALEWCTCDVSPEQFEFCAAGLNPSVVRGDERNSEGRDGVWPIHPFFTVAGGKLEQNVCLFQKCLDDG